MIMVYLYNIEAYIEKYFEVLYRTYNDLGDQNILENITY